MAEPTIWSASKYGRALHATAGSDIAERAPSRVEENSSFRQFGAICVVGGDGEFGEPNWPRGHKSRGRSSRQPLSSLGS